jgi:hypothetical protein
LAIPQGSPFKIKSPLAGVVQPFGREKVYIEFIPMHDERFENTVEIETLDGVFPVPIHGVGVEPSVLIYPLNMDYGWVHWGNPPLPRN